MVSIRRPVVAAITTAMVAVSPVTVPVAFAQGDCPMLPTATLQGVLVAGGLPVTNFTFYEDHGTGCTFLFDEGETGGSATFGIYPGMTLAQWELFYPDLAGAATTAAGLPGVLADDGETLAVEDRSTIVYAQVSSGNTESPVFPGVDKVPAMTGVIELLLPLVKAPSTETLERVAALLPTEVAGVPVNPSATRGDTLTFLEEGSPGRIAVDAALAQLGRSPEDLTYTNVLEFVDNTLYSITLLMVDGADLASVEDILLPVAIYSDLSQSSTVEIGGKQVRLFPDEVSGGHYVYTVGDTMVVVNGPAEFLEEYFSSLP